MRNVLSLSAFAIGIVLSASHLQAQRGDRNMSDRTGTPEIRTASGYVFVDGVALDSPYAILFREQSLSINGQAYDETTFDLPGMLSFGEAESDRRGQGQRGVRGHGPRNAGRRLMREIGVLEQGGVVIFESGQAPIIYQPRDEGHDLLEFLLAKSAGAEAPIELPETLNDTTRQTWNRLAADFQMTPDFTARATEQVQALNFARDKVEREFAAKKLSDRINYPLTMFAMVLVVFAAGHLMVMSQPTFSPAAAVDCSVETKRNVIKSLVIVALLSILDLVWTLIAHQNGSMRELNPIGGALIDNSTQLLVFKVSLTAIALGLLFWLRSVPLARKATWWCCLVLTLLTVRWLTFHSMFA